MYRFGSHVSIRNGYLQAAKTAQSIGCKAFQYFPKNPRSLGLKAFDSVDAECCAKFCRQNNLTSIAHAPYPTNLAATDPSLKEATVRSILNDLDIVEACGSVGLVIHFGKIRGYDLLQGYKNILQLLNDVISQWKGHAQLLIENQAGDGGRVGTTMEEMVQIRNLASRPQAIGFCLDSCHAFASGLWTGGNWHELLQHGNSIGYFDHVKAVHLNDSLFASGSLRDRHANIGKGKIGVDAMKEFLQSSFLHDIPIIMETPVAADGSHRQEMRFAEQLTINNEMIDQQKG